MNCNVIIDYYLDAHRLKSELVLVLDGGTRIVIYPIDGTQFTIPHDSGIVSPFEPDGLGCSFETRTEAHNDRDLIGIKGKCEIFMGGTKHQSIDDAWFNFDPAHVSMIYIANPLPKGLPKL